MRGEAEEPGCFQRQGTEIIMLITRNQPRRALLISLTAAPESRVPPPPAKTCEGGRRVPEERLSPGPAVLSSCMEIIPMGSDCFLGERGGGGVGGVGVGRVGVSGG